MCRAAYENFADFLSAFSSCINCRNYFKLCSEAVFSLAEPSSLGDGAGGKGATPTITLITLNIGVLTSAGDAQTGYTCSRNVWTWHSVLWSSSQGGEDWT